MKDISGGGGGEIVQVEGGHIIRATGRKDRHSKVFTAKGPRDRRVRLSAHTAIEFYDVQDRLGYDRPSKAVDWLIKKAKSAIDNLDRLPPFDPRFPTTAAAAAAAYTTTATAGGGHHVIGAAPSSYYDHPMGPPGIHHSNHLYSNSDHYGAAIHLSSRHDHLIHHDDDMLSPPLDHGGHGGGINGSNDAYVPQPCPIINDLSATMKSFFPDNNNSNTSSSSVAAAAAAAVNSMNFHDYGHPAAADQDRICIKSTDHHKYHSTTTQENLCLSLDSFQQQDPSNSSTHPAPHNVSDHHHGFFSGAFDPANCNSAASWGPPPPPDYNNNNNNNNNSGRFMRLLAWNNRSSDVDEIAEVHRDDTGAAASFLYPNSHQEQEQQQAATNYFGQLVGGPPCSSFEGLVRRGFCIPPSSSTAGIQHTDHLHSAAGTAGHGQLNGVVPNQNQASADSSMSANSTNSFHSDTVRTTLAS